MTIERYGSLIVLGADGRYRLCRCDCGVEKRIRVDHLQSGATVSCGCVGKRNASLAKTTHGMSRTRVFKIWLGMIDRCKNDRSGNYGSRGISVCDRWQTFENFYSDMGEPPTPLHSIDRKHVNGNYQPGNCRWATAIVQARNTRANTILTLGDQAKTIAEWSEVTGIKSSTICVRLAAGWAVARALTERVANHHVGKPWEAEGISRSTWYRREGRYVINHQSRESTMTNRDMSAQDEPEELEAITLNSLTYRKVAA